MNRIYSAIDIAKWFISEINPEPLKLQKLLYLSQGFCLALNDVPLFSEDIEAWVHGPVIPSIYHNYKQYKYKPIIGDYNVIIDPESLDILNYVKNNYGNLSSRELEYITHNQDPWIIARDDANIDDRSNNIISKTNISNYFTNAIYQPDLKEWD